ncbi:hypothetical protein BC835DRAFT_1419233 [Cytidiella melzeri]|nr:hypothetical protein BC835DRAFT_1419233 [Cytidiella melzeri]
MTTRPPLAVQSKQRPLSAIYIGSSTSISTPPDLPRLPEPPSPGGSPDTSETGLPSPPATNSTGSVGDDTGTSHTGSLRKRTSTATHRNSYSASSIDMYDGRTDISRSSKTFKNNEQTPHSNLTDDEDDPPHENDNNFDEDTTARFDNLSRRRSYQTPSAPQLADAHSSALQRVKSLTERNRMVLSKLSSIQRLSSPVPPNCTRSLHSSPDIASPTPHSRSSTSSSRPSTSMYRESPSASYTPSHLYHGNNQTYSGSETERESRRVSYAQHQHSSSDSMSNTPTSVYSEVNPLLLVSSTADRQFTKSRRFSAPTSPEQDFRQQRDRDVSPTPTPGPSQARTPRKRSSHAVTQVEREEIRQRYEELEGEDIMAAALAAVASSRHAESIGASAGRGKTSRNLLPSAFRDGDEVDNTEHVIATPHRDRAHARLRRSPSPSTRIVVSNTPGNVFNEQRSPRRREPSSNRTSTVRELTRKHQTRWLSEDLSASHGDAEDEPATPSRSKTSSSNYTGGSGRRQLGRHGSIDNNVSPSKRIVDEGLRAAGIKRRDGGGRNDVFVNGHSDVSAPSAQIRRTRSTGARSTIYGDDEWESPISSASTSNHGGPPSTLPRTSDPRTPATALQRYNERQYAFLTPGARPVTSMAALHHDTRSPRTAPPAARAYRATSDHEASSSAVTLDDLASSTRTERPLQTPSSGRLSTAPGGRESHAEHRRLMLEALGMFESQLSRLPPMGLTSTSTIPDVFQTSQQFVHALDRLNSLIRSSAGAALEAQIEAEIEDAGNTRDSLTEVWQQIGADEREKLRLSDEIVRSTTQFLLGVGKVLRDCTSAPATAGAALHLRSMSLDEEAARRYAAPDTSTSSDKKSSDGRQSGETRRSWDPREPGSALKEKLANLARSKTANTRPSSALQSLTRGSSGSNESRSTGGGHAEQTPPSSRLTANLAPNASIRRLYTPREKRVVSDTSPRTAAMMSSLDSQETIHAHDPSPTPASRLGISLGGRARALPPLAVAPSLPTLPSESLLRKENRKSVSPETNSRRKVSTSSNLTIRAEGSSLPSMIKPPNATTAVTTATVSNSATSESPPSMSRTNSRSSGGTNGVTFSRSSTISALNGLQQHVTGQGYLSRTASTDSTSGGINPRDVMSGSETERPRTYGTRGRASLDAPRANMPTTSTQSLTLNSTRKERRRTITEIFAQVNK